MVLGQGGAFAQAGWARSHRPDLPGHGDDKTPVGEVSLQSCVDRVVEILDYAIKAGHPRGS